MNIREYVVQRLDELDAEITVQDAVPGVLFHDEGEFIPFSDLGYNAEYGFYRLSHLSQVVSDYATTSPYRVRALDSRDWPAWVLDVDRDLWLLGETWQVADLVQALQAFLATGQATGAPVDEYDPDWSVPLSMADAVDYVVRHGWPHATAADTLRRAAWDGRIPGARKDAGGKRWRFSRRGLDQWLAHATPR